MIQASALIEFLAECITVDLLKRCQNHLLVKLASYLDFGPIEAACAS